MREKLISWIILLSLVLIWGSSFILIKKGLSVYSSQEVGALRIVISFLALSPLALARISKIRKKDIIYLAIAGLVGSVIPAFLFAKAQTGIDSNLAGILNSLTPLFTLIIGLSFFGLKTRWYNVLGVLIGLAGAIGLISISGGKTFSFNLGYAFYVIIATICYALNVNIIKKNLRDPDAVTITSMAFFIVGIPMTGYLLVFTDFSSQVTSDPRALEGLGYIAILALFGTAVALIAFNYLIKTASVLYAASVTYMIPIIAVIWGIGDGEKFEVIYLTWIIMILAGVFLVNINYRNRFFERLEGFIRNKF